MMPDRNRLLQQQLISPEDDFAYGQGIPANATWRNLLPAAEFGLSVAPGSGEAMALRDAWNASGQGANALLQGRYGDAASDYGNMLAAGISAIPGAGIVARGTKRGAAWMDRNLPAGVNKLLDAVYPTDPKNTLNAIPAWHGSPYDFNEFKLENIGTGDTGTGFGHGLYFADHPQTASLYRDPNAPFDKRKYTTSGYLYETELDVDPEDLLDWDNTISGQSGKVKSALQSIGIDVDKHGAEPVRDVFQNINSYRKNADADSMESDLRRTLDALNKNYTKENRAEYERANKAYKDYKSMANPRMRNLSEQETTELLREAGIPGVQFRDYSSALHTGDYYADEKTLPRNYSIFDDKKIRIQSKSRPKI